MCRPSAHYLLHKNKSKVNEPPKFCKSKTKLTQGKFIDIIDSFYAQTLIIMSSVVSEYINTGSNM